MDYIPYLIPLWIIAFFIIIDVVRKGSLKKTHADYTEKFFTTRSPIETFKAIMAFATQSRYQIDDFDEKELAVILNERMTWNSYGSLYPIYVREQAGRTMVEIGVTSKLGKAFLFSPFNKRILNLRLERMHNAVRGAVFAYERTNQYERE